MLDIIYHNQRLNADGSPVTGDSYAWELYHMLLQLSLIKTRQGKDENADRQSAGEKEDEISPYSAASAVLRKHIASFGEWLENAELPESAKRTFLRRLVKEEPELLVRWLEAQPKRRYISLLADLMDEPSVLLLNGHVSLQLSEAVSAVSQVLYGASTSVSWLKGTDSARLTEALHIAVLEGIGAGMFHTSESIPMQVVRIAGLLHQEITGRTVAFAAASSGAVAADGIDIPASLREFVCAVAKGTPLLMKNEKKHRYATALCFAHRFVEREIFPEEVQRMLVLQWFDMYHGKESELVLALQSEKLLEKVIGLLDDIVLSAYRNAVSRIRIRDRRPECGKFRNAVRRFACGEYREGCGLVSRPAKELWQALFVSLSYGNNDSVVRSGG